MEDSALGIKQRATLENIRHLEERDDQGHKRYQWFREWVVDIGVEQFYEAKDQAARRGVSQQRQWAR